MVVTPPFVPGGWKRKLRLYKVLFQINVFIPSRLFCSLSNKLIVAILLIVCQFSKAKMWECAFFSRYLSECAFASHLPGPPSRWWWVWAVIGWGQAPPPTPRCPRCCRRWRPAERDTSRRPSTVYRNRWGSHLDPPATQPPLITIN